MLYSKAPLFACALAILTISFSPTTRAQCTADLNGDQIVGLADLGLVLQAFGISLAGDVNDDGLTGLADLGAVLQEFGATCSACADLQGFGVLACDNAGEQRYVVTSLADSGTGTLRDAISTGNRHITFAVGGTIQLNSPLVIYDDRIIIDGSTAPAPGVTIVKSWTGGGLEIQANDVIVRYLRLRGNDAGEAEGDSLGLTSCARVIVDHVTLSLAGDEALPVTYHGNTDITISNCLIYGNDRGVMLAHGPNARVTFYRNVLAKNAERSPQFRHQNDFVDFRNNIVYDWGVPGSGYGMRLRADSPGTYGDGRTDSNIVANAFVAGVNRRAWGLVYGIEPGNADDGGPATPVAQGAYWPTPLVGQVYVSGNLLPAENRDHFSTVTGPLTIPGYAQVSTAPATSLADVVLPDVGTHHRTVEEQALIDEVASALK